LRLTSISFPAPNASVAGRDAFTIQARPDQGLVIGEPMIGMITKEPTFLVTRRIEGPNKSFEGIASVTVAQSYFNDYWGKLRMPKGTRITLLRGSDARAIAQFPAPQDGLTFFPIDKAAFDQAVAGNALSGSYAFMSGDNERMGA
ncbi:hypothetical protein RJP69_26390, partial [Escherichia coli]|uniref:PDC sensor domain-containing protein n=1 Tax=Escherichia coli TaxID=562 RepID=UPI0028756073